VLISSSTRLLTSAADTHVQRHERHRTPSISASLVSKGGAERARGAEFSERALAGRTRPSTGQPSSQRSGRESQPPGRNHGCDRRTPSDTAADTDDEPSALVHTQLRLTCARVGRGADGAVAHLDLGSFVLTREPYAPADVIPGDIDPIGWRAGEG
jgi:hypothetical protein